jgi:hypothetical protein
MRRTIVAALLAAAITIPATAASAAPEDDAAELSETIEVAWAMPGTFQGYATFPQTYLPGGVPECGEGGVQVDVYKYGTPEVRALVDELVAGGVLASPADDARVAAGRVHWFVALQPCDPTDPGFPEDPDDPDDPLLPGGPTNGDPPVEVLPTAQGAVPIRALPAYAG